MSWKKKWNKARDLPHGCQMNATWLSHGVHEISCDIIIPTSSCYHNFLVSFGVHGIPSYILPYSLIGFHMTKGFNAPLVIQLSLMNKFP